MAEPYGMNYDYGLSPYYKDEGDPTPVATYRHYYAMYKLFPAPELLTPSLVAVT